MCARRACTGLMGGVGEQDAAERLIDGLHHGQMHAAERDLSALRHPRASTCGLLATTGRHTAETGHAPPWPACVAVHAMHKAAGRTFCAIFQHAVHAVNGTEFQCDDRFIRLDGNKSPVCPCAASQQLFERQVRAAGLAS
jgi:hypothetical protein